MTGKFIFSMQIMFLGLSVVMVSSFTFTGLWSSLTVSFPHAGKKEDNNPEQQR